MHPPDPYRRIAAKLVDLLIALLFNVFPAPVGVLCGFLYLALADGFFRGQSLGKFLFRFRVVCTDIPGPCTLTRSLLRNGYLALLYLLAAAPLLGTILALVAGSFLVPTELYALFFRPFGERIGDLLARTRVIPAVYELFDSVGELSPE